MALVTRALTTLATAKQHLGISAGDLSQDARLEIFINAATSRIESMTDRTLKESSIVEIQHGGSQNLIMLRQFPVTSIAEVMVDVTKQFVDPTTIVDPTRYFLADDGNSIAFNFYLPKGFNNVKVSYTAGYNAVLHDTKLAELELVCLWLVEWFYKHRERGDMGRTNKSKGDESVGILSAMPVMIREIISCYTRTEAPASNLLIGNR